MLLVQQSMARQVRVITCEQGPALFVVVSSTATVTLVPQQASSAVGSSKLHAVPHSTVLFVAQVRTGGKWCH